MKVEIGKRYRFEPNEACAHLVPPQTVVVAEGCFGLGAPFVTLDGGGVFFVRDDGGVPEIGRLVEIEPAIPRETTKLPPVFRHDTDEHRRLQNLFRNERDLTLGTGH